MRFYDFAGNSCLASLDIAWDDDRMIMMISFIGLPGQICMITIIGTGLAQ